MATWKLLGVDTLADYNGYRDVITTIHFCIETTDGVVNAKHFDKVDLNISNIIHDLFIPYGELTEEQILALLKAELGVVAQSLEQAMQDKLVNFKSQGNTYISFTG